MQPSNALTPYPVLCSFADGYEGSEFDAEINADLKFNSLRLGIEFSLTDEDLLDLISQDKAAYAIHIESPSISYRKVRKTTLPQYTGTISQDHLNDCVEICTFVIATKPIAGFRSRHFNADFDGLSYDIGVGGILAIGPSIKVDVDDQAKLASGSSIIKVTEAPGQPVGMRVNTDQSAYALITLSPELYDIYFRLGDGCNQDFVFSLILLPAMQTILSRLADGEGEDKEWALVLIELLEKNGIKVADLDNSDGDTSILKVSQMILDEPLTKAMLLLDKRMGD